MIRNKYFDIYLENPLKTYNKIKTFFRPIKPKFYFSIGKSNKAKILELNSFDLLWKDKYDSPRHEVNPRIDLSLFNRLHMRIEFGIGDGLADMVYWEAALYWIHYKLSLPKAINEASGWGSYGKDGEFAPDYFRVLHRTYQWLYDNNELEEIMYENSSK